VTGQTAATPTPNSQIYPGRYTAQSDRAVVLFLIGMRINRLAAIGTWWPVAMAMPRMLAELRARPEAGMLFDRSYLSGRVNLVQQYWRSFDQLLAYAQDRQSTHFPAWSAFNRAVYGAKSDAVGIWHETYLVEPGKFECIYGNMPLFGLAAATSHVPATGRLAQAKERMSETVNS
jgi:Domain of unknown function (DUF4188)